MQITKQRKLFICILTLLVLLASVLLLIPNVNPAQAATLESNDKYNFTLTTNEDGESSYKVAIKPAYRSQAEFIVIPETNEGLPVTEIAANGFVSCAKLTKVILPTSVRIIGNNAFMNCSNLKQVSMPNVQSIGTNAFGMCVTLERVFIPDTVTEVGSNILRNNPNTIYIQSSSEVVNKLWSSTWSNYFTGDIVYSADPEDTIQYREILATDNQTVIGYEIKEEQYLADMDADIVIYNCVCVDEELGYLPVLNICQEAFLFSQVNSITIKDRHTDDPEVPSFTHKINIRSNAFLFAIVQEIKIEVGVTFNHPENLQTEYSESMFDGQPIVGDSYGFSTRVFEESYVKSITLPSDIYLVTERMFYNCTYLESIKINGENYDGINVLPDVRIIGAEAFSSCVALKNITVPESVSIVGEAAFSNLIIQKQEIYVDIYEDELPEGWSANWAVNNDNDLVKFNYKPLTYIAIELHDNGALRIGVKPGKPMPEIKVKIERDGYNFKGIYSSEDDGGFQYYNADLKSARVWNVGDPETLYVHWEAAVYTITYANLLDGVNPSINPKEYTIESETITFANPAGRNGYDGGWDIASIEKGSLGNKTITAVWQAAEYKITYVNLLGGVNPSTNPVKYTIESETINFANPAGRNGYDGSWDIASIEKGSTGDKVIVAVWRTIEYTIKYEVDLKGQANPNPVKYTVESTFMFVKLEAEGYTFSWNPAGVTRGTTGNLTVKGIWKAIEYTISYDVDLKGQTNPNPTKYTVEDEIAFVKLEKDGYEFKWNTNGITKGTTGNIIVIGSWTINIYNIIYDVDLKGLTNPNQLIYDVETEITFTKLEKAGYAFEWSPAKINKGTSGALVVKGSWIPVEYNINYDMWNGTVNPNPKTYNIENVVTFEPGSYNGYKVEWDKVSTKGCMGDITVKAFYYEYTLARCYNSFFGRYEINNINLLDAIRHTDTTNKTFNVNVDYNDAVWTPIPKFFGTLTGTVKGVRLELYDDSQYYGFIIENYGNINNFNLDGTIQVKNIHSQMSTRYIGLLCGYNGGTISDCTVKSSNPLSVLMVNGVATKVGIQNTIDCFAKIGGLVGRNNSFGNMTNCKNYLNIYTCGDVGGIVSDASGKIINCYNYGEIRFFYNIGARYVGGIASCADGVVKNSVNYGNLYFMSNGIVEDRYYSPVFGMIIGELDCEAGGVIENCTNNGVFYRGYLTDDQIRYARGQLVGFYLDP